jgi:heme/copper-type cytochrome/quinol oxidase subunit 2
MKRFLIVSLAVTLLGAGVLRAGAAASPASRPAPSAASKVKSFTIVAVEGKITPDVVRVRRGDLVRLTFRAKDGTYGVHIPVLKVKEKASPEHPVYVEFAATSEGEYEIRCTRFWSVKHWSENGKIVVE